MKGGHAPFWVALLLTAFAGDLMAQPVPKQPPSPGSPSVPGTITLAADRKTLRECFEQGAPGEGCLLRVAAQAKLPQGVRATVVAPAPAGTTPAILGQVTLGSGMAASGTSAYAQGREAFVAIDSRLNQHTSLMKKLREYQRQRELLQHTDQLAQRRELDAGTDLGDASTQLSAIPDRTAEKEEESRLCTNAATLQAGIDRLRTNAATLLGQMRTALGAASAAACSTPADAQAIRAGWKKSNDLAADLRRALAEAADKTAQRRKILATLNHDRTAKDTTAGRLSIRLDEALDTLAHAQRNWSDAGVDARQARESYVSVLAGLSNLQLAVGTQPPNPKGPDWVFGLFDDRNVRAPYEAFREAVDEELASPPKEPLVRADPAWMTAHEKLGRDIQALKKRVTALQNDLNKRACDAVDHDTLNAVRLIVSDADVEIEKYQGLPAKADACDTTPAPSPVPPPPPRRLRQRLRRCLRQPRSAARRRAGRRRRRRPLAWSATAAWASRPTCSRSRQDRASARRAA